MRTLFIIVVLLLASCSTRKAELRAEMAEFAEQEKVLFQEVTYLENWPSLNAEDRQKVSTSIVGFDETKVDEILERKKQELRQAKARRDRATHELMHRVSKSR